MKNLRKKIKKQLCILLIFIFAIFSVKNVNIYGETLLPNTIYNGKTFQVNFSITSNWGNECNVNLKIKNISNTTIDNWYIKFDFPYEITNIWNAKIISYENGIYILKNNLYNQDISPNQTIEIGFNSKYIDEINLPKTFDILSFDEILSNEKYKIDHKILTQWNDGYTGKILITNLSNEVIEDWSLEFESNIDIKYLWNAEIIDKQNSSYIIKNKNYNSNILPGETLELGFEALGKNSIIDISNTKLHQISYINNAISNNFFTLTSNKKEIISQNEDLYFYLEIPDNVINNSDQIVLYENSEQVAIFYDDGDYRNHGDDIKGDGIYSAKYCYNDKNYYDHENNYYAQICNSIISNTLTLPIYINFSNEELSNMEYVSKIISNTLQINNSNELIVKDSDYIQNSNSQNNINVYDKYDYLIETLNKLINEKCILDFSIDETNGVINCKYSNGIPFSIILYQNLTSNNFDEECFDNVINQYFNYNALILNAFEDSSYRTKFYEKLKNDWTSKGLNVDYDDTVTINDLKIKLYNKDIIALCGHGTIINHHPVFCLNEEIPSKENDNEYSPDLKSKRIIKVHYADGSFSYVVTSDFFKYYYDNNGLDGSYIFSESCDFMGNVNQNGIDYNFANAFLDCSAEVVVGFYNSVIANYSRKIMVYYFNQLFNGNTAVQALNSAKNKYGINDFKFRKPSFWDYIKDHNAFTKLEPSAAPLILGNMDSSLIKPLQNGDFEIDLQEKYNKPLKWTYSGDVRILKNLGSIHAYDNNMVFLSTGIGSQPGIGFSETQGSTLSQKIHNKNNKTLEFTYNFISEEPMEYLGSKYDDKFEIQILDENNQILYNNILESVNKSDWFKITDINFDGGDDTVYETKWKNIKIDISKYQNSIIKIKFLIFDVGDSNYDSAVVIDNIKIY